MDESIYNLFLFVTDDEICEIGVVVHQVSGDEAFKYNFLQSKVHEDFERSQRFPVTPISHASYMAKIRLGTHLSLLEPAFIHFGAAPNPLMCITPIIDGVPTYHFKSGIGPLNMEEFQNTSFLPGKMPDYLQEYLKDDVFDMSSLINDDFLLSIKLLFNERKYVSTAKLFISMIDSIAFIEHGDISRSFQKWLNQYAELQNIGITSDELWEFRNSLLHMTNLHSRQVKKGKVACLIMYVGDAQELVPPNTNGHKYFNLMDLINNVNFALGKWLETYSSEPKKMEKFIERYDLTVSDSRMAIFVK